MPLEALVVRRFDVQNASLDTVALGSVSQGRAPQLERTALRPAIFKRLLVWAREGQISPVTGKSSTSHLAALVSDEVTNSFVAGPLTNNEGPAGALVLIAAGEKQFSRDHLHLMQDVAGAVFGGALRK